MLSQTIECEESREIRSKLNDALLERYIVRKPDIRTCPKQNCKYAGVIDLNPGGCYENLTCQLCNHQWKDPLHNTPLETLKKQLKDTIMMRTDAFSHLSKLMYCEPCPNVNCNYLI